MEHSQRTSSIPLVILVLSIILLKERVYWQRWVVVIVGLWGIIVTLNPSSSEFNSHVLILLISALLYAILDIINKTIVSSEHIIVMLLYSSIVVSILSFIPMIFYWKLPIKTKYAKSLINFWLWEYLK